jgi:serine/threonine protein kinase
MSSNDPLIGKQLGDYKIVGVLGQGGMARVYRGFDDKLERFAAVKVFDTQVVAQDDLDEYRARFQREARSIGRLRHPNIVGVYQFGQADHLHYMAMVFIEGRDLRYILKEHAAHKTRMSFIDILRIISDVASALDHAHHEGVIHRDIKPSNIMITAKGHATLTDFGLALNIPEGTIGTTFGSVHYIAPEQAVSSAQAVPQSDLYSLGVVLYEMLTGKVPFDDQSAMSVALKHLSDPPPPPSRLNPEITPEIENMVLRALDKEPQKRYQTGMAFVQALETAFGMTDEDEVTRKLMALPDWALNPDLAMFKAVRAASDLEPSSPSAKTATPIGTEKTISEKSAPPRIYVRSIKMRYIGIGVSVALLLMVAGSLLIFRGLDAANVNTPTALVATSLTQLGDPMITLTTTPDMASTETPVPTTSTRLPPTETSIPSTSVAAAEVTDEPTNTPRPPTATLRATATPRQSATPETTTEVLPASGGAQVRLVYNDQNLMLLNRSDEFVDVSDLVFVQVTAQGRELAFRSNSWDGSALPSALPPGDCFEIWTSVSTELPKPDGCGTRHAFFQTTSVQRLFWISDIPTAIFEVRRGDQVLAECAISAGECLLDVRGES